MSGTRPAAPGRRCRAEVQKGKIGKRSPAQCPRTRQTDGELCGPHAARKACGMPVRIFESGS